MSRFYLIAALLGAAIPYAAFAPWLLAHGTDVSLLIQQGTANPISLFAWLDVIVAAVVLMVFVIADGRARQVRHWYLAVLATLVVGVSCGLPLYLYLRNR
jgi:hypothetical protein